MNEETESSASDKEVRETERERVRRRKGGRGSE